MGVHSMHTGGPLTLLTRSVLGACPPVNVVDLRWNERSLSTASGERVGVRGLPEPILSHWALQSKRQQG
jgi:hypothetical protein